MTDQDLIKQIRLGEDSRLEFKRVVFSDGRVIAPETRAIADEFSAMANGAGGIVVFGVDDKSHDLMPMKAGELDILETWIRNIALDIVDPPLDCIVAKVAVGDEDGIIRVDIARSLFVHKGGHGYYGRVGSSKRELTPEELARLFQQKSQSRIVCFDEQIVPQAKIEDMRSDLRARFRTVHSDPDETAFLRKLHFASADLDGTLRPTVGGILMACEHPEQFLPSAYIQAVAYRSNRRTAADQLDARDIVGPLDVQVMEALRFVKRNMRVYAVKNPGRIDIPQFSESAIFEALVNAVAHRDYSIAGAKIRMHMFSDRIEIFSPGGLPNSLTLEEMPERQFTRNELICSVIARCKITETVQNVTRQFMMDRRGEGVPIIIEEGAKYSGKLSKYELLGDSELKLTIYSAPGDSPHELLAVAHKITETSQSLTSKVKAMMVADSRVTQKHIADALGVSRSLIAQLIVEMKAAGLVVRIGSDRSGEWRVMR